MTGRKPLLWPFVSKLPYTDSIKSNMIRLLALKRTVPVSQTSRPENGELSLQLVQLFVLDLKKSNYFRLLGDNPIRVIAHNANYNFIFCLTDWSQGTICLFNDVLCFWSMTPLNFCLLPQRPYFCFQNSVNHKKLLRSSFVTRETAKGIKSVM